MIKLGSKVKQKPYLFEGRRYGRLPELDGVVGEIVVLSKRDATVGVSFPFSNPSFLHTLTGFLKGDHGRWFLLEELVEVPDVLNDDEWD